MPVRSLSSSVLKWPGPEEVHAAVRKWVEGLVAREGSIVRRVGYVGSYARGDWGVGSDVDLVIIVGEGDPMELLRRWWPTDLPVPADLQVYTEESWERRMKESAPFRRMAGEAVWLYP